MDAHLVKNNSKWKACQPIHNAGPSVSTPAAPNPIIISSDSEEDLDPKGSSSEEEDPEMDPEGEDQGVNSSDESEEVSEYIPEDGPEENQDPGEEEPKEEDLDEPEEYPEEDPEEDPEMEEEEAEVMEPDEDEYNEYFANYFKLTPPPSPDSSIGSPPPTDA
ncbi:hypothetical protein PIB30_094024 [Stylosanthes scabra]|uniref:Uncharacterized protein n=1 Tax=Stylosanthes scabra TaxID=79078 RepID=A0ABU6RWA5_9FABA|nr:hypothetical protein [Stylosanthes scabra]